MLFSKVICFNLILIRTAFEKSKNQKDAIFKLPLADRSIGSWKFRKYNEGTAAVELEMENEIISRLHEPLLG